MKEKKICYKAKLWLLPYTLLIFLGVHVIRFVLWDYSRKASSSSKAFINYVDAISMKGIDKLRDSPKATNLHRIAYAVLKASLIAVLAYMFVTAPTIAKTDVITIEKGELSINSSVLDISKIEKGSVTFEDTSNAINIKQIPLSSANQSCLDKPEVDKVFATKMCVADTADIKYGFIQGNPKNEKIYAFFIALSYFLFDICPLIFSFSIYLTNKRFSTTDSAFKKLLKIIFGGAVIAVEIVVFVIIANYNTFSADVTPVSYIFLVILGLLMLLNAVVEYYLSRPQKLNNR